MRSGEACGGAGASAAHACTCSGGRRADRRLEAVMQDQTNDRCSVRKVVVVGVRMVASTQQRCRHGDECNDEWMGVHERG